MKKKPKREEDSRLKLSGMLAKRKDERTYRKVEKLMGKDSELLGVNNKNIDIFGKGIAPEELGKKNVHLFLE